MKSGVVVFFIGLLTAVAAVADEPVARFALVIGNNQPDRPGRPMLRHADDDAVGMYRLLHQAGVQAVLLVTPDEDTRRAQTRIATVGAPTRNLFSTAFSQLRRKMKRSLAAGKRVELYLFFSGHGDVIHGEGYLAMDGWRLTRSELAQLLTRSPAAFNHVIIDACSSYFIAFGRGPGGKRLPAEGFVHRLAAGLSDRNGFLLSTSADRESHEWERFGAGVFSHLVMSALRGAADVDVDGQISYAEVGAFLDSASAAIEPENLRPRFFLRPPGMFPGDLETSLVVWPDTVSRLITDIGIGRAYLEDATGMRLIDLNSLSGQMRLVLPENRPLFLHSISNGREWTITGSPRQLRLSEMEGKGIASVSKGAVNRALDKLFRNPFRTVDVNNFRHQYQRAAALAGSLVATIPTRAGLQAKRHGLQAPCPVEGKRRCRGDLVQLCTQDELGDTSWQTLADCSRDGDICRQGECRRPGFGGKLVFTANFSGANEVWVMNDDGSELRRLSRWSERPSLYWGAFGPRWSPDGTKIAFSYGYHDNLRADSPTVSRLCVIDQNGQGFKVVSDAYVVEYAGVHWRSERSLVANVFQVSRKTCRSWLVSFDVATGSNRVMIEDSPDGYPNPTFPDVNPANPQLLLYRPYRCGQLDAGLRVFDMNSGGERVLALPGEVHDGARWSPDGRQVAWVRIHERQIVMVDFYGRKLKVISPQGLPSGSEISQFDWTEGGFVFTVVPGTDAELAWLWVCDRDGSNSRPILSRRGKMAYPDWAPGRLPEFNRNACQATGGRWDSDTAGSFGCWFAGEKSESCNQACNRQGLACRQYDWNDFPNGKICRELTGEGPAQVNNPAYTSNAPHLYYLPGTSHGCYHRALDVRQDCSASPGERRRICLCGPFE